MGMTTLGEEGKDKDKDILPSNQGMKELYTKWMRDIKTVWGLLWN